MKNPLPRFLLRCPIIAHWCYYKGEKYFGMLNYERSIQAGRTMIDLSYCATKAMNGIVEKTVMYSKKKFQNPGEPE